LVSHPNRAIKTAQKNPRIQAFISNRLANIYVWPQNHDGSQDFLWWIKPEMGQFLDSVNQLGLNEKCS
jgi:hypothetical protein